MNKKISVIGASGLIGNALCESFKKKGYIVEGYGRNLLGENIIYCDITQKKTLKGIFSHSNPNVVILTAALSNVDYCEEHPEESEKINVHGLKNLLDCMKVGDTKIVYLSSDYIFDGLNGPYSEDDYPNPISVYGRHKLQAEELIKKITDDYLIIRTTWVYGPETRGKNFVLGLIERINREEKVKIPFDQIGSPTYSKNLADVIEELVRKNKRGIYNIVGPKLVDRYSFAKEISDHFGFNQDRLMPVSTVELGQKAKRPLKAGLKIDKIKAEEEVSVALIDYNKGLNLLKQELNKM